MEQRIRTVALAVLGCGFEHRPGAPFNWRRDAASTRKRGRLRYVLSFSNLSDPRATFHSP
jgi:hypothetical protein